MILTKYIFKKIFRNQLIILILLFFICICQKLIKVFGLDNNMPIDLIFLYLFASIPELGKLIIPFSLFLSVIITYYYFHIHNEILAMYSCAIKKSFFIQKILLYSLIIAYLALINISWLSPYCEQYRNHILCEMKKNSDFDKLIEKKFQLFSEKKIVLFINRIHDTTLQDIFIVKNKKYSDNTVSVMIADQGDVYCQHKYVQSIFLKTGTYYEINRKCAMNSNTYVTNFSRHQILINYNSNLVNKMHANISNMFTSQLFHDLTVEAQIELNWRLTLLISIVMMPLIAVLLMANISYNYLPHFLLAIILYIIFFLSHILLRSYAILYSSNFILWTGLVNFIYFIIGYLINVWKNFRLNNFFKKNFFYFFKI